MATSAAAISPLMCAWRAASSANVSKIQKVVGAISYDIPITLNPKVLGFIEAFQTRIRREFEAGLVGKNVLGKGFDCEIQLMRGAGAYISGLDTALLETMEGKKAWPRQPPPFPTGVRMTPPSGPELATYPPSAVAAACAGVPLPT